MSRERLPTACHRLFGAVVALVLIAVCLETHADRGVRGPSMRLRVEWSAEKPAVWAGQLRVKNGSLDRPFSLGLARDDAGTLSIERNGDLSIRRRSAQEAGGLEIAVTAGLE